MKINRIKALPFLIIFFSILFFGCKKEDPTIAILTSAPVSDILLNSVVSGGFIESNGGEAILSRGVCWSLNENPTIDDFKTEDGIGAGSFTSNVTNLTENTVYYLRAYAINSIGIAYGENLKFSTGAITDIDGNVYRIVTIGDQVWMVDNLKTTRFNDGTVIPLVSDSAQWANLTSAAYCWSDNDEATYKATYGAIYNFFAVENAKLCPEGWHVPTIEEWNTLTDYFYGHEEAGSFLKEEGTAHWVAPNAGATNESGFTALPGKFRSNNGPFASFGYYAYYWMFNEYVADSSMTISMIFNTGKLKIAPQHKGSGLYVRCIKDETVL